MKIEKNELVEKLSLLKNTALGWKGILDISNTFIFTGEYLIAYNDKTSMCIDFKTDFECCIPGNSFFEIVNKIKKDTIEIKMKGDELNIKGGNIKAMLKTINTDIDFIKELFKLNKVKWKKLPEDFFDGLYLCSFSVSKDLTRPVFTALYIKDNNIFSTDNLRISHYEMEGSIKDEILIPASSLTEIQSIKDFDKYHLTEGWIYFKNEFNIIFALRTIEGDFPDAFSFFENVEGSIIELPNELLENLEAVSVIIKDQHEMDRKINVQIFEGQIICKGEQETGWVETVDLIDTKEQLEFVINPQFFYEVLKKNNHLIYDDNVVMFHSKKFNHIISLFSEE